MPGGGATNYAERMFHSLTAELPCRVDARRHATPILATDFAQFAYAAHRRQLCGLYHLAGAERTSPHRFAAELAATLGVPGKNVRLVQADEKNAAVRLDETSLNIGALRERLTTALPMLREGLGRFVDQGFNGYRDRLPTAASQSAPSQPTMQAA
jgi:dTDP-4-dehydrorhamnose reductase